MDYIQFMRKVDGRPEPKTRVRPMFRYTGSMLVQVEYVAAALTGDMSNLSRAFFFGGTPFESERWGALCRYNDYLHEDTREYLEWMLEEYG